MRADSIVIASTIVNFAAICIEYKRYLRTYISIHNVIITCADYGRTCTSVCITRLASAYH